MSNTCGLYALPAKLAAWPSTNWLSWLPQTWPATDLPSGFCSRHKKYLSLPVAPSNSRSLLTSPPFCRVSSLTRSSKLTTRRGLNQQNWNAYYMGRGNETGIGDMAIVTWNKGGWKESDKYLNPWIFDRCLILRCLSLPIPWLCPAQKRLIKSCTGSSTIRLESMAFTKKSK